MVIRHGSDFVARNACYPYYGVIFPAVQNIPLAAQGRRDCGSRRPRSPQADLQSSEHKLEKGHKGDRSTRTMSSAAQQPGASNRRFGAGETAARTNQSECPNRLRRDTPYCGDCRSPHLPTLAESARPSKRLALCSAGRRRRDFRDQRIGGVRIRQRLRRQPRIAADECFPGRHSFRSRSRRVAAGLRYRPGGGARRAAAGRSLRHESDRPGTPGGVIAPDGDGRSR